MPVLPTSRFHELHVFIFPNITSTPFVATTTPPPFSHHLVTTRGLSYNPIFSIPSRISLSICNRSSQIDHHAFRTGMTIVRLFEIRVTGVRDGLSIPPWTISKRLLQFRAVTSKICSFSKPKRCRRTTSTCNLTTPLEAGLRVKLSLFFPRPLVAGPQISRNTTPTSSASSQLGDIMEPLMRIVSVMC